MKTPKELLKLSDKELVNYIKNMSPEDVVEITKNMFENKTSQELIKKTHKVSKKGKN